MHAINISCQSIGKAFAMNSMSTSVVLLFGLCLFALLPTPLGVDVFVSKREGQQEKFYPAMSTIDYFQDFSKHKLTIIFTRQIEIKDLEVINKLQQVLRGTNVALALLGNEENTKETYGDHLNRIRAAAIGLDCTLAEMSDADAIAEVRDASPCIIAPLSLPRK